MSEYAAIEAVVGRYFQSLYACDADALKVLFEPKARVTGYYEGEYVHQSVSEYLGVIRKLSSPDMIGEDFDMKIVSIEIQGDTALCKTDYLFEALRYGDFLSLIKVHGEWRIINKTFWHR